MLFPPELLDRLPGLFLDLTWKATCILIVASLVANAARRSSSAFRHGVWTAALFAMIPLPLPLLSTRFPRLEVGGLPSAWIGTLETRITEQSEQDDATKSTARRAPTADVEPTLSHLSVTSDRPHAAVVADKYDPATHNAGKDNLTVIAFSVWLVGALSCLLSTVVGLIQIRRLTAMGNSVDDSDWATTMSEEAARIGLRRCVHLHENSTISVPMTTGILRPTILLPTGISCSSAERRRILQHELAHVARFDIATQIVGRVVCSLYWFHPLVWRCLDQMYREREQACDDWVLQSGERATDYADQLLSIAQGCVAQRIPSAAVGIIRGGSLENRVKVLLDNHRSHERLGSHQRTLLVVCAVIVCVPLAVIHPKATEAADVQNVIAAKDNGPSANEFESATTDPTKVDSYTVPINASGRAIDANGNPIADATIYMSTQGVLWDTTRIAETKTNSDGQYVFENVMLPILRANTNDGRDHGGFLIFGRATGHGFAWRATKQFYPKPNPDTAGSISLGGDLPRRYQQGDKINLDLVFAKATTISGRIVDGDRKPIANAELSIWDAERIPADGFESTSFAVFANDGFELLNAAVPDEMWIRHTDADGRFEFTGIPSGCRFRVHVRPPGFPSRMVWIATQSGLRESYGDDRLYDASQEVEFDFGNSLEFAIQVIYEDTGKPAPNVFVSAGNQTASLSATTDADGRVTLKLPSGEYHMSLIRANGTPYLETRSTFTLGDPSPPDAVVAKLSRAARVEVHVVDKETGKGLQGVDLWRENTRGSRDLHFTTSWEAATRIVHRESSRSDENGLIKALFAPGKHRIGVAWMAYPSGYRPVEKKGIEIECSAETTTTVVFHLEREKDRE